MSKKPQAAELTEELERLGLFLPVDLVSDIRIEAAKTRQSMSAIATRRLRESYAKSQKRESANAL